MFSRLWNPGAKGQGRVHVRREERAPPAATSTDTATDTDTAATAAAATATATAADASRPGAWPAPRTLWAGPIHGHDPRDLPLLRWQALY